MDIEKETVDMRLNFDDTLEEPTVLPTRIPNLLVNGASGIAVGMATNMLPHNLSEAIDACVHYVDNKEATVEDLMQYVKAPDFPTGGTIHGVDGVRQAFMTGRGRVVLRGKATIEPMGTNREQIIISEIPYQVIKSDMIKKIAELVEEKKIEGITDVRDESDRDGIRVVIELHRDAMSSVVLNQLYALTPLQTSYGVNNVALVGGRPMLLNLRDMIRHFVDFRHEVIVRRTRYELREAEKRAHILQGLLIALDHLDEVIKLIRESRLPEEAREGLISNFGLSDIQARAILDLRLQRLTGLERDKIREEYDELMKTIAYLNRILNEEPLRYEIIKTELLEIKEKYGDLRRTDIEFAEGDINIEDLIPNEEVVVTISHLGYVKRTVSSEFKTQNRGGRGSKGSASRDEDFIEHLFVANNHNYILFFTQSGRCYWIKVYELPEGEKTSKGRAIQNLMNIPKEDKIVAYLPVLNLKEDDYLDNNYLIFCTKNGIIKKTTLRAYSNVRKGGVNAIEIREGDDLVQVAMTHGKAEIVIDLINRFLDRVLVGGSVRDGGRAIRRAVEVDGGAVDADRVVAGGAGKLAAGDKFVAGIGARRNGRTAGRRRRRAAKQVVGGRTGDRSSRHVGLRRITDRGLQGLIGDRLGAVDEALQRGDAGVGSLQNLHAVADTIEQVRDVAGAVIERSGGEEVGRVVEGRVDLLASGKAVLRGGEQLGGRLQREQVLANRCGENDI